MFANVLGYAIELEELTANPLDRLSWKPPKVSEVVDRRMVVNPRQARQLLIAVTYCRVRQPLPRRRDTWAMEDRHVVAAILRRRDQLLLCHRSPGRRWYRMCGTSPVVTSGLASGPKMRSGVRWPRNWGLSLRASMAALFCTGSSLRLVWT